MSTLPAETNNQTNCQFVTETVWVSVANTPIHKNETDLLIFDSLALNDVKLRLWITCTKSYTNSSVTLGWEPIGGCPVLFFVFTFRDQFQNLTQTLDDHFQSHSNYESLVEGNLSPNNCGWIWDWLQSISGTLLNICSVFTAMLQLNHNPAVATSLFVEKSSSVLNLGGSGWNVNLNDK